MKMRNLESSKVTVIFDENILKFCQILFATKLSIFLKKFYSLLQVIFLLLNQEVCVFRLF